MRASVESVRQLPPPLLGGAMPSRRNELPKWNADRLTDIRRSLGVSPESLAAVISKHLPKGVPAISGRKIRRWESGKYAPDAHELTAICGAFGITDVSTFFTKD